MVNTRIRLGDLLVAQQLITYEQLQEALSVQKHTGFKLGKQLIEMEFVEETSLLNLLSKQLNCPFIELKQFQFDRNLVRTLPETLARRYRVMVLRQDPDGLLLGMSDPTDILILDDLQKVLKTPLKPAVIRESDLLDILDVAYSRVSEITSLAEELHTELESTTLDIQDILTNAEDNDAPVVRLLQTIFEEAINTRASDIHIEPDEHVLRIRQRIDGVLVEHVMNEKRISGALVVRLKLMAGLNISEKRLPQDGRFNLKAFGHNIDVRVSTMPVQFGESVVMRLVDHSVGVRALRDIGMPEEMMRHFQTLITRPHGLVLVTGPTGSGKTTTLYGALTELNQPEKKIITVEDPVEIRLPRINQVQVHDKIDLTFATVLRAALRQDPDVLLIGEIRDAQSAEIALRAAMTGHLVLSTLHTNDAVTSALRLIDMGVDAFLVASSLKAVVAQRLVRRVCEQCKEPYTPSDVERDFIYHLEGKKIDISGLRYGKGCSLCFHTGFRGRLGVFELLEINGAMAEALREDDVQKFTQVACNDSRYRPLNMSALALSLEGETSLSEVLRLSAEVEDERLGHSTKPASES